MNQRMKVSTMNMSKKLFSLIWYLSETLDIPLGKYAPYVFHKMIGSTHYEKVLDEEVLDEEV